MSQKLTILSLIARGMAAFAALHQIEVFRKQNPDVSDDAELVMKHKLTQAELETIAGVLSGRFAWNATALDMLLVLRYLQQPGSGDSPAWAALIKKLITSNDPRDQLMADVLQEVLLNVV